MAESIHELYGDLWGRSVPGFDEDLERSLDPRGFDTFYDLFHRSGVRPGQLVLDLGSRDARHAVELAKRFGCRCIAIDPIPHHLELARQTIDAAGLAAQVTAMQGAIEALPQEDGSIDAIWCRDVLNHVRLPEGLTECFRVLRPGGFMFIYVTLATDRLEPKEAGRLFTALAIVPDSMDPVYFEAASKRAGFEIATVDRFDSEGRERAIEAGETGPLRSLLHLARMRRREEELAERYGRNRYEAAFAGELWGIYQYLGKLCPTIYVLNKP